MDLNNYFNLKTGHLSEITIRKSNDGSSCYVAWNNIFTENPFVSGFIISDKQLVVTICEVSFYPSKNTGKFIPRLIFSKVLKSKSEVRETAKEKIRISFSSSDEGAEEFWLMIKFLSDFKDLVELGTFGYKYEVVSADHVVRLVNYMDEFEKGETAKRIIVETFDDPKLIEGILTDTRKKVVEQFENMLNSADAISEYKNKYSEEIPKQGEEAVWQHFFKTNQWILGLNSGLIFIDQLLEEQEVGISNTKGKSAPIVDYMGVNDYTLLVELKKPDTPIFTNTKSTTGRANTWSFSSDFIDGVSQCLAQKTDWEKTHTTKNLINSDGEYIDQIEKRTIDPKTIFIIGRKDSQFPQGNKSEDTIVKRDTFERYRRNNRNIEIITYDELLIRSKNILNIT